MGTITKKLTIITCLITLFLPNLTSAGWKSEVFGFVRNHKKKTIAAALTVGYLAVEAIHDFIAVPSREKYMQNYPCFEDPTQEEPVDIKYVVIPPLVKAQPIYSDQTDKVPFIYHPDYNVKFFGLENLHNFDSTKAEKVYKSILKDKKMGVKKENFYNPAQITDFTLKKIHSKSYLDSFKFRLRNLRSWFLCNYNIAKVTEMWPIAFVPPFLNFLVRKIIINSMMRAASGTILGAHLAQEHGWAINFGGGFHHAQQDTTDPSGYCFFSDISLAINSFLKKNPGKKVMYVDLDCHQGNGVARIFKDQIYKPNQNNTGKNIAMFDMYCNYTKDDDFPSDDEAKEYITWNHPLDKNTSGEDYLSILKKKLPEAINEFKPDFIFYNAGTDVYIDDVEGDLKLTFKNIKERDEFVFRCARTLDSPLINKKTPILMVLSGGYSTKSAEIIFESIKNLWNEKLIGRS